MSSDWIKMPVLEGNTLDDSKHPKYPIIGSAKLVYHGQHVYVSFKDKKEAIETEKLPDTYRLTFSEEREINENLPYPLLSVKSSKNSDFELVGLGDIIAWFSSKLGIKECEGCKQRKRWLNRFVIGYRHRRS